MTPVSVIALYSCRVALLWRQWVPGGAMELCSNGADGTIPKAATHCGQLLVVTSESCVCDHWPFLMQCCLGVLSVFSRMCAHQCWPHWGVATQKLPSISDEWESVCPQLGFKASETKQLSGLLLILLCLLLSFHSHLTTLLLVLPRISSPVNCWWPWVLVLRYIMGT